VAATTWTKTTRCARTRLTSTAFGNTAAIRKARQASAPLRVTKATRSGLPAEPTAKNSTARIRSSTWRPVTRILLVSLALGLLNAQWRDQP